MRGRHDPQATMLAFVDLEERVPTDHPLRTIKVVADEALERLSAEFDGMYSKVGRASVPPERLLKASLLICLYSVRSERAFCEELEYNLLFRWFLDMNLMERSFDPTVFTKNRRRLLEHRIGQALFDEVAVEADRQGLLSAEHFSVDGTLIEAAASIKSFRRRDEGQQPPDDDPGNPSVDFRGERRSNETHQSRTDPEAQLMRKGKGKEAKLVFMGHALMENRNGLLMDFVVSGATGTAERDAVPVMLDDARQRGFRPKTLGGDRGYDTRQCVKDMRNLGVTPHVAQRVHSAIDGRTTRHSGYGVSQKIRKRVEEIFGWMKTVGGFRRTRYRGVERTGLAGYFVATAYNLVRRVPPDSVSRCGAYWAGWILCGYGLQPGADGKPVVVPGAPGRSVGVTCPGRSAPKWPDGARGPRRPPPESSAGAPSPSSLSRKRRHCPLNQLRRTD